MTPGFSGSSSLKFQLIATDPERRAHNATGQDQVAQGNAERLCRGVIERIGGEAIVTVQSPKGPGQKFAASVPNVKAALGHVVHWMDESGITKNRAVADIDAIGHRIVHSVDFAVHKRRIQDQPGLIVSDLSLAPGLDLALQQLKAPLIQSTPTASVSMGSKLLVCLANTGREITAESQVRAAVSCK